MLAIQLVSNISLFMNSWRSDFSNADLFLTHSVKASYVWKLCVSYAVPAYSRPALLRFSISIDQERLMQQAESIDNSSLWPAKVKT